MLLEGKRIFVFEDDAMNLAVIRVPLKREGATVYFDRWGKNATEALLKSLPLDIILLDLMYPDGTTGYDIFKEIHNVPEFQGIPIVVVTAADPDREMPIAQELGLTGFISKPINSRFPKYIAQAISGKPVWEAE